MTKIASHTKLVEAAILKQAGVRYTNVKCTKILLNLTSLQLSHKKCSVVWIG